MVRRYVMTQIQSLGYATLEASNASDALRIIDDVPAIDLLFTDVIMPGAMNGRQLVDEALKRRPGLKTLYTSGYTGERHRPSWPAGFRRAAAGETLPQIRTRQDDPAGACRLSNPLRLIYPWREAQPDAA